MEATLRCLGLLRRYGEKLGPYVLLELVMPGGTLLALLLFLYRRRPAAVRRVVDALAPTLARIGLTGARA